MERRRTFSREFKLEGVKLFTERGVSVAQAKKRGRLSPVLAGTIAIELGEEPQRWIAIAALEAEKESPLLAS
ncbi:hypothetical protein FVQ98_14715 [Ottowia sp. GY511]|nr:hypothetical protein FVQ98_14715 [Ottowia sp. GY511]